MEDWVLNDDAPESARRHSRSWPTGYVWLSSRLHNEVQARIKEHRCAERSMVQVIRSGIKWWLEQDPTDSLNARMVLAEIHRQEMEERTAVENNLVRMVKEADPRTPFEKAETLTWAKEAAPTIQDPDKRAAFYRYLSKLEGE